MRNSSILPFMLLILTLSPSTYSYESPALDLRVVDAIFIPSKPIAGFNCLLMVTVENSGDAVAEDVKVVVDIGDCILVNITHVIGPGEAVTVIYSTIFQHAGEYTMNVKVDPDGRLPDVDRSNNQLNKDFEVKLFTKERIEVSELDLETEEGKWGFLPCGGRTPCTTSLLTTVELNPTFKSLPNYHVIGRRDPGDPNSKFESQNLDPDTWKRKEESACGTTSLAALLRYLKNTATYDHNMIDSLYRGGNELDVYTDPYSIKDAAEHYGLGARVYVDGSLSDIKWFIDHGIPVLMLITVTGKTGLLKGVHWIVPICYWEDETLTYGLNSHIMIGYYNPWGYQCAIPEDRLERYWKETTMGGITLWNRVYVAVWMGDKPQGLPTSNIDAGQKIIFKISKFTSKAHEILGTGLKFWHQGFYLPAIIYIVGGAFTELFAWITAGLAWLVKAIGEAFKWLGRKIWEGLKKFGCKLFGVGCPETKLYYYYYYSQSPTADTPYLINGMIREIALGYLYAEPGNDRTPIYEYQLINPRTRKIIGYRISTNPDEPVTLNADTHQYPIGLLGYALTTQPTTPSVRLGEDCLKPYNIQYEDSVKNLYLPLYHQENSNILWLFNATGGVYFLSTDIAAGTQTFPYTVVDKDGDTDLFHLSREYIIGYIPYNPVEGTKPLIMVYDPDETEFFLTTDLNEEPKGLPPVREMVFIKIVGFIFTEQKPGTVPLYKYYAKERGADYLFTTKEIQDDNFELKGVIGYIYEMKTPCSTELWLYCYRRAKKA